MTRLCGSLLVAALAAIGPASAQGGAIRPERLRCEYAAEPLGVETPRPRLSWQCAAVDEAARGLVQSAFRVLVASSAERLARDEGDLWDSGRVESPESLAIEYDGLPLGARMQVWWKVRLWDGEGRASDFSAPASFTMGVLRPEEFAGRWIAAGAAPDSGLAGAQWVWTGESDARLMAPAGTRHFLRAFDLPAGAIVDSAHLEARGDNDFTLRLNDREVLSGSEWRESYSADVTAALAGGANVLTAEVTNTAPGEAGLIAALRIAFEGGETLTVATDDEWRWSPQAPAGPEGDVVAVLGEDGMAPWGAAPPVAQAMPIFRRGFAIERPLRRAVARVCGLGQYELSLNGAVVNTSFLDPGWTNYRATSPYDTYDVTQLLHEGRNALGVMLGNGMYHVPGGRYVKFTGSFGEPKLALELTLEYADGAIEVVASDDGFRWSPGPITFSCTYGGEDYDARREQAEWNAPAFDDSSWARARVVDGPGGELRARREPPVVTREVLRPIAVRRLGPASYVYDLGRNTSAIPRIAVRGEAGRTVRLTPGELVDQDGRVTQASSGGPVWFDYSLRGGGAETWNPRFTYYGFRYVQVDGAAPPDAADEPEGTPRVESLEGLFITSGMERASRFSCSDDRVARIRDLILTALESNAKSVLTDCPHREKLGWLEQSHLIGKAIMLDYDAARLYGKIAQDTREAQTAEGLVPDIAPEYVVFGGGFRDSPEWGAAAVIVPWLAYVHYGDRRVLEDSYEAMCRYVAYLGTTATGNIVSHGLGDWYDVGTGGYGPSQLTSFGLTATACYYQSIAIIADTARLLGRGDDAERYTALAAEVREAFNAAFYHPEEHSYDRNSQTANAMPLVLGLAPEGDRAEILDNLVAGIRAGDYRVTAGDVGFSYVVEALTDAGRGDVLYEMIVQDRGPGYLRQLAAGATSLTEAWDANRGASQNHFMLGHAELWFHRGAAGLRPDDEAPGFAEFTLAPQPVAGLEWARGEYDTVRGTIVSAWERVGDRVAYHFRIPANTTATLRLPAERAEDVEAEGLRFVGLEDGCAVFEAGSGSYDLTAPAPGATPNPDRGRV